MHVFYVLALSHLLRIALFHRQNSLLHPVFCSVACSTLAKLRKMRKYALNKILPGWSLSKQLGSRYPHCVNLKLIHFEHISQFSLISANAFLYFQHNFHAIMLLSLFFARNVAERFFLEASTVRFCTLWIFCGRWRTVLYTCRFVWLMTSNIKPTFRLW